MRRLPSFACRSTRTRSCTLDARRAWLSTHTPSARVPMRDTACRRALPFPLSRLPSPPPQPLSPLCRCQHSPSQPQPALASEAAAAEPASAVSLRASSNAAAAEPVQLRSTILACTSVEQLLSLYSQRSSSCAVDDLQLIISCMRSVSHTDQAQIRGLTRPMRAFSLSDPRFLQLVEQLSAALTRLSPALQARLLRDFSRVLLVAQLAYDEHHYAAYSVDVPFTLRTTGAAPQMQGIALRWPAIVRRLLDDAINDLVHKQRMMASEDAQRVLHAIDQLMQMGFVHAEYPRLLSVALRVLADELPLWLEEAGDAVRRDMGHLALLMSNLHNLSRIAELADIASVVEDVVELLWRLPDEEWTWLVQWAPLQLAPLFILPGRCGLNLSWRQWERLCHFALQAVQAWSVRDLSYILAALSKAAYYHEPLLLALAAHVLRLLAQANRNSLQDIDRYGCDILLSFTHIRVHPQHPVIFTLFAVIPSQIKVATLRWHDAVQLLLCVVVMRYHYASVEAEVMEAWKGCDAATSALLMKGDNLGSLGQRADVAVVRRAVVARRRTKIMQVTKKLLAHIHELHPGWREYDEGRRWRVAMWRLARVQATLDMHRRRQPTAQHLPPLSEELQSTLRGHLAKLDPERSEALFAPELLALLAELGYARVDPSDTPPHRPFLLQPVCVQVPYPTPASPSGSLCLLVDFFAGTAEMYVRRFERALHPVANTALRTSWLEGSGWPFVVVDALRWATLVDRPRAEQLATLEQWVKQAVQEWEQRMAWPGWGDVSASMEMEQPRQAYRLYRERHGELIAQTPPPSAAACVA